MKNGTAVKSSGMTILLLMSGFISNHCGTDADGPAAGRASAAAWQTVQTRGRPVARHECAFVEMDGKFYLLGGRSSLAVFSWFSLRLWGEKPVNVYDPATNTWSAAAEPPMEIHHFQPVVFENRIWVLGALTGGYPHETPVAHILIYDPRADKWTRGAEIPSGRRRGSCGVVVHAGKIYMAGGIADGHHGDFKSWFDEYDPETGAWRVLPDAPRPRDHFQAAVAGEQLYAIGGRRTSKRTGQVLELTVKEVDIYDFGSSRWTTLDGPGLALPTPRAGASTVVFNGHVLLLGGESAGRAAAHDEVEAFDVKARKWKKLDPLLRGRHGTGALTYGGKIYVCAGSGNQGAGPELDSLEVFSWKEH